ncbi:MAG TPA: iron chelate uptake ABC transporter family permease subunit [Angustibacter sp.]|nr:iron chelate uptake ABC transporter family permease subunit [Angustibacter sp.]
MTTTAARGFDVAGRLHAARGRDRRRAAVVVAALLVATAALAVLALGLGMVALTPAEVLDALLGRPGAPTFIVLGLRLPRVALALVVGAALGLSGALLQAVARNPLASPDVVGLTGGASTAAVLAIGAGATGVSVDAAAFAGALAAAALVFGLAGRGVTGPRFVVVGVTVAFLAQGVLGYALTRANLTRAESAFFWLVGSVGTAPWSDVARVTVVLVAAAVALVLARRPLTLLALDDDTVRAVGGRPTGTRTAVVVLSSVLAAVAVSVAGPVAFVAFVAGPLGRRLRGTGSAPFTAALVGAVLVLGSDLVAQHVLPLLVGGALKPPVGLVTGALGAPVLLWLLVRGERRKDGPA